jgi:hypothetical protein
MPVDPMKQVAPYGSWRSPITADLMVNGAIGLSQPVIDGADIYWIEMRPAESGRQVIVKRNASGQTSATSTSQTLSTNDFTDKLMPWVLQVLPRNRSRPRYQCVIRNQ